MQDKFWLGLLVGLLVGIVATGVAIVLFFVPVRSSTVPAVRSSTPVVIEAHQAAGVGTMVLGALSMSALAQSSDSASLAERLAERLLGFWGDPSISRTELIPGGLPVEFDIDVPHPEGVELLGSVAHFEAERLMNVQAVLESRMPAEAVLDAFRVAFTEAGWTFVDGTLGGGFLPAQVTVTAQACMAESGHFVYLTASSLPSGTSDVRLDANLAVAAYNPPCDPAALTYRPYEGQAPLPALRAPSGAALAPHGAMQMPDQASSSAIITTELGVVEIGAHYAAQIASAGWMEVDTSAGNGHVFTTWIFTDTTGASWTAVFSAGYLPGTFRQHALGFFVTRTGA